jgi:hypothetical protein
MNDTGRPDDNGLLKYDCLTLWLNQAADAAGLTPEMLTALITDAAQMAREDVRIDEADKRLREGWPNIRFNWSDCYPYGVVVEARAGEDAGRYCVPVAFWGPR